MSNQDQDQDVEMSDEDATAESPLDDSSSLAPFDGSSSSARDKSSVSPPGNISSPPTDAPSLDDTLHFKQLKCCPPGNGNPSTCWTPWFLNFSDDLQSLAILNLEQILFLEYVVLCRTVSTKPSQPGNYSAIIFMVENCFKTARKPIVLRIEGEMLDFISHETTLENLYLKPMERDEGIFRDSELDRRRIFQKPFASGRSEDKLTHVVRGFLMLDQRIDSVANSNGTTNGAGTTNGPRTTNGSGSANGPGSTYGTRRPVRRLADSPIE